MKQFKQPQKKVASKVHRKRISPMCHCPICGKVYTQAYMKKHLLLTHHSLPKLAPLLGENVPAIITPVWCTKPKPDEGFTVSANISSLGSAIAAKINEFFDNRVIAGQRVPYRYRLLSQAAFVRQIAMGRKLDFKKGREYKWKEHHVIDALHPIIAILPTWAGRRLRKEHSLAAALFHSQLPNDVPYQTANDVAVQTDAVAESGQEHEEPSMESFEEPSIDSDEDPSFELDEDSSIEQDEEPSIESDTEPSIIQEEKSGDEPEEDFQQVSDSLLKLREDMAVVLRQVARVSEKLDDETNKFFNKSRREIARIDEEISKRTRKP